MIVFGYFSISTSTALSEFEEPLSRRGSKDVPCSPEADVQSKTCPGGETGEQDRFYLLKKESQRRTTLSKVLMQDEKKIFDMLVRSFERDVEGPLLKRVSWLSFGQM